MGYRCPSPPVPFFDPSRLTQYERDYRAALRDLEEQFPGLPEIVTQDRKPCRVWNDRTDHAPILISKGDFIEIRAIGCAGGAGGVAKFSEERL